MSSYYIHAGRSIEETPMREGSLYLYDQCVFSLLFFFIKDVTDDIVNARSSCSHREGWYDFFANATSVTNDGFCDDSTIGMKHVAVRDAGRESTFKPNKNNMFPRPAGWKPSKSNTHKEHFKN